MIDKVFRKLPGFKGKTMLANMILKNKIRNSRDIVVKGKYSSRYLLPSLKENIALDIFVNGVYEQETIDFLDSIIPPGGQFLDLGSNIGAILVPLCNRRNDINALAVEAAPWIYDYLSKNILLNGITNAILINKALFDKDDVELDFFSPLDKFGKGSLSPVFSKDPVKVMTRKVDTLINEFNIKKVDAIKVDVEGYEYFVFKGAEKLLTSLYPPQIFFEFVDWAEGQAMGIGIGAAQRYLLSLGYQLYVMEKAKPVKIQNPVESGFCNLLASKRWK